MKKSLYLLLMVLGAMFSFSSCNKDKTPSELIVGEWSLNSTSVKAIVDGKVLFEQTIYADENMQMSLFFNKGGNGSAVEMMDGESMKVNFTWEIVDGGKSLSIAYDGETFKLGLFLEKDTMSLDASEHLGSELGDSEGDKMLTLLNFVRVK